MKRFIDYIKQIYSDASGQASLMRYLSTAIVLGAIAIPFVVILKDQELTLVHAGLVGSMLTIGVGGKAVQKHLERRK